VERVGRELTFTPEAMIAATSFCQTSTVSQESLLCPAMVGFVGMLLVDLKLNVSLVEGG
jgi:hypothetical protein